MVIVGDFNVHVCCPDKPMARDILNLIDYPNLVQTVSGPTQEHRQTSFYLVVGLFLNLEIFWSCVL